MSEKRSKIGKSPLSVSPYIKFSPCGECHTGERPIIYSITEFGKEPKAEVVCKICNQCFESHNYYTAIRKWNQNADPKILAFPTPSPSKP